MTLVALGAHRLKDLGRPEQVFQVCHPGLRREFPPLRSLDAIPNNLPVHLTSFIGREAELADLACLASQHRLVTLTGSGGVGKTRLAAAVAAELAGAHADGAWWVELAPLADPALVTEALLGVLQVGDAPGSSALRRLTAYLATRDLLVVLDNCEHVLDACAAMSEAVLRTCPGVAVLATSREALGVGGEVTWQVPPLALPAKDGPCPVESLGSYDAVRLFANRAVKARPNFAVTNATAPVVAEICAHLDGIPLAIELAAARIRVLSPQQILDGLEDRFRLLTGGARGGLRRQQTLEASVAWSHDLLTPEERVLFRRLSVFAGGFTLDAAETGGAGSGPGCEPAAVLDLLDGLAAKSLVVVEDDLEGWAHELYGLCNLVVDPEAGKAAIAAALPLLEESGDEFLLMKCTMNRSMIAVRADDTAAAPSYLDQALALSETHGNHLISGWNLALVAVAALRLGSLPQGRAAADRSIALSTGSMKGAARSAARDVAQCQVAQSAPMATPAAKITNGAVDNTTTKRR